jgi:hypothetical protein
MTYARPAVDTAARSRAWRRRTPQPDGGLTLGSRKITGGFLSLLRRFARAEALAEFRRLLDKGLSQAAAIFLVSLVFTGEDVAGRADRFTKVEHWMRQSCSCD